MAEKENEQKKKILIIDDEAVNRAILEDYLSNFGYEIYMASNGSEGVDMLAKTAPDLVLLDIKMPDKDGFQTLEEIKRTPGFSNIPVLFLSALNRSNLKVKGLELGAEDYITRPFDKAELLARIRAALRRTNLPFQEGRKMEGDLSDLGLIELLQPFAMGKKTAAVKLTDIDAEVIIEAGRLVHVRQGRFTGRDALNRILLVEKGEFSVVFNKIPANISKQPVEPMKAMMDSLAYIDEIKTLMEKFVLDSGIQNPHVIITPEIKKRNGAQSFKENQAIPLVDLVISLVGDLKEVVQFLLKMYKDNTLKLKPGAEINNRVDNK
ncbi:MAG: response regulator [Candidatus Aminicenantes bacterium]|jgi:DNA-binding response OmpR family regulator